MASMERPGASKQATEKPLRLFPLSIYLSCFLVKPCFFLLFPHSSFIVPALGVLGDLLSSCTCLND